MRNNLTRIQRDSAVQQKQRLAWTMSTLAIFVCSCLSILVSTFYFPSHYYLYGIKRETSMVDYSSVVETSLGRVKYGKSHAIAWLLSFPESGSQHIIANLEHMTNSTTATNYAKEVLSDVLQPLNPGFDAPFLRNPPLSIPNFVLTKSHCTGYCDACHSSHDIHNSYSFEKGCRTAYLNYECWDETRSYHGVDDVHKLVHLIRSPLDTLVARMHAGINERRQHRSNSEWFLSKFSDSRQGLQAWCQYVDQAFHDPSMAVKERDDVQNATISPDTMKILQQVPCHSEIFRYVQFQNLVVEMAEQILRLESPVHVIHYEDHTASLDETSRSLARYLEQPVLQPPMNFIDTKSYDHMWSNEDKGQVSRLVQHLATPKVWSLLKRYFDQDTMPSSSGVDPSEAPVARSWTNRTELVWFLSFPQSGSSLFMSNIMKMSQTNAASHYYQDAGGRNPIPVWPNNQSLVRSPYWMMNGPHNVPRDDVDDMLPQAVPHKVLTRNYCTGGCLTCPAVEKYETFDVSCRTVPSDKDQSPSSLDAYHLGMVREFWVLVRNPFDVIRSRTTTGLKEHRIVLGLSEEKIAKMQNTREALVTWCTIADQAFRDSYEPQFHEPTFTDWLSDTYDGFVREATCPARWFSSSSSHERYGRIFNKQPPEFKIDRDLLKHYEDLPCYSDWVRIAQWYNYALEYTTPRRTIPRKMVRFEDYFRGRTLKLEQLVRALDMEPIQSPRPFNEDRARPKMIYAPPEARKAVALFKSLASKEVWNLFRSYFEDRPWSNEPPPPQQQSATEMS